MYLLAHSHGFFNTVEVKDTYYAYLVNLSSSLPHT